MIAKMTPIEWFASEINGMDTAVSINAFKELFEKAKQLEKLKNHSEYMRGWYNGFNSQEIETKGLEKTAVEWLYNKMYEYKGNITISEYEQAKEMEKQQMKMAQMHYSSDVVGFKTLLEKQFEDWYNEKFKSK